MSDPISQLNAVLGGRYRIVRQLGEGGMGTVYLAEQTEPVKRQVALKLLLPGSGSEEVIARFDAERQALAVMDHPAIAKVFDAGETVDGRSYFVMEFVEGASLTEYCDEHHLSVTERARLFAEVCQGVQHAHQKGVIHRDIKPSNILVSDTDGRPRPRIIDFGIAKATQANEFDGTQLTRDDQVIGTPAYMAPEQLDGSADIDTRSDVYSLGVVLYELLVGALPFDASLYRGWAAVAATLHRDAPTLSRRFGEIPDRWGAIADARSTSPPQLRKELSGDIGWIVARAMEKERDRRYETVNALVLDLGRFLRLEPVEARGVTTAYVLRRFVRRNRMSSALAASLLVGLIGFSVVTAIQAQRIARARDEAEARRGQAEGLIDFMLSDLREKLEPVGQLPILNDVSDQAAAYFAAVPEDQFTGVELERRSSSLYQAGLVQLRQGEFQSAVRAFSESLRQTRALSERDPDNLDRLFDLSQAHFYVGYAFYLDGDLDSAEEQFLSYLDVAERLVEMSPGTAEYLIEVGYALGNLGTVSEARGDLTRALDIYETSLRTKTALHELDSTNVTWLGELAETHNKLGVLHRRRGNYREALAQHSVEFELKQEVLGIEPEHAYWRFRSAMALLFLARLSRVTGDPSQSIELSTQQLLLLDSLVSFDPTNTLWQQGQVRGRMTRAGVLADMGRVAEATADLMKAEEVVNRLVALDTTTAEWLVDRASVLTERARIDLRGNRGAEALALSREAIGLIGDPQTSVTDRALVLAEAHIVRGHALESLGRAPEALDAWQTSLDVLESLSEEVVRGEARPRLAEALLASGREADAEQILEELRTSGYVSPALDRSRSGGPG